MLGSFCTSMRTRRETASVPIVEAPAAFSSVPMPAGSGAHTFGWDAQVGATGWMIYISPTTQLFPDDSLYAYRYYVPSGATLSLAVTGRASGTYYCRLAAIEGTQLGELSHEFTAVFA